MYPNLYYVFKDWFGVEWKALSFLNTFGLMVALGFLVGAWLLSLELKRKEKHGLLTPVEETIIVGKPVSLFELLSNGLIGFIFGYKILGLFWHDRWPQVIKKSKVSTYNVDRNYIASIFIYIDNFSGISEFVEAHQDDLEKYFEFTCGVPSHDTYQRLWSAINPE